MRYRMLSLLILTVLMTIGLVACKGVVADFEDSEWVLDSYGEPCYMQPVIEGSEITATFNNETHEVSGSAGCNSYFAEYEVDDNELSIAELAYTEMACLEPEGVMEQEQEYLQLLILTESYNIEDGKLYITCSDGSVLTFGSN